MKIYRDDILTDDRAVIGQVIVRVSRLWRKTADQALDECGLSHAMAQPLLCLWFLGGEARQGAIAEEAGLVGPSIVRIMDLLIAEGLVTRREDPQDRRAKIIAFTEKGRELVSRIWDILTDLRQRLLADIGDEELVAAVSVLRKLERSLDQD